MSGQSLYRIKSIDEFHRLKGLPKPKHPLISVVKVEDIYQTKEYIKVSLIFDFYVIAFQKNINPKVKFTYGQQHFDFNEGIMGFLSPNQIFTIESDTDETKTGLMLLIHADFLWNTSLAKTIKKYDFFNYSVHEALWLSDKEETMIINIVEYIEQEYHSNIDNFSKRIIIAQLELLLSYADRFYHRQFLTREKANHQILERLESLLSTYFNGSNLPENGIPTVQYISKELNVSANYLATMLKLLTGESTQQLIQNSLIEKAKEKLSTTELTVSEIAYELGFDFPQSFSRLFKNKTRLSPLEFRQSFYLNLPKRYQQKQSSPNIGFIQR